MIYLHNDKEKFKEIIDYISRKTGIVTQIIEKDYYVTMILRLLAEQVPYAVFKGGTSLSKCYKIINRFSEDIDIAIDTTLSQGQKKRVKQIIVNSAHELGMKIINLDKIRSRRDYNRYMITYDSVTLGQKDDLINAVLLETTYAILSFPTAILPVHNYISDTLETVEPNEIERYYLNSFNMKVQGVDRTLVDKVFALCDYYLTGNITRHSRHIYDIYKLLPLIKQDADLEKLIKEVRIVRAQSIICPSAKPEVNVPKLLNEIIKEESYKQDYDNLTRQLLQEEVPYETAIVTLKQIAESNLFIQK